MVELKKLKLGAAVMLDKNRVIHELVKNKNFNIKIFQPFNDLVIDFLNDFSNELKSRKKAFSFPDLIYFKSF